MNVDLVISNFEKKLEGQIKSAFEFALKRDDEDEIDISADYETHVELERIVNGLGLSVYGMAITPSEFTITFEFEDLFNSIQASYKPRYCSIHLDNDGNYDVTINLKTLERNWRTTITDMFNFNTKKISADEINDVICQMEQILMIKVLSN